MFVTDGDLGLQVGNRCCSQRVRVVWERPPRPSSRAATALQHLATGRDGGRGLQGEELSPCCPAEEAQLWELDGKVQGPEELQVFTLWGPGAQR